MWAIPNYCHGMKCHKLLFLSSWRSYFTAFTGSMAAARSNDYEVSGLLVCLLPNDNLATRAFTT